MLHTLFSRRPDPVTLDDARARAARGATYLDGADAGWHRRVQTGTLALGGGQSCVLGQLHGGFRLGLFRSGVFDGSSSAPVRFRSPVDLGFHARRDVDADGQDLDYVLLTRAWREEIARRREPVIMPAEASAAFSAA